MATCTNDEVKINVGEHYGLAKRLVRQFFSLQPRCEKYISSEDMISEVMMQWVKIIKRYDSKKGKLSTFLYRVGWNICMRVSEKEYRDNNKEWAFTNFGSTDLSSYIGDATGRNAAFIDIFSENKRAVNEDIEERSRELQLMEEVICGMENVVWRDYLVMRVQGSNMSQIAKKYNVTKQAVHATIGRAMRLVKERMEIQMSTWE